jgi:hypothetical protein
MIATCDRLALATDTPTTALPSVITRISTYRPSRFAIPRERRRPTQVARMSDPRPSANRESKRLRADASTGQGPSSVSSKPRMSVRLRSTIGRLRAVSEAVRRLRSGRLNHRRASGRRSAAGIRSKGEGSRNPAGGVLLPWHGVRRQSLGSDERFWNRSETRALRPLLNGPAPPVVGRAAGQASP